MAVTSMRRLEASTLESSSQFQVGLKSVLPAKLLPIDIYYAPTVWVPVPNAQEAVSFYKAAFDGMDFVSCGTPMVSVNDFRINLGICKIVDGKVMDKDDPYSKKNFYVDTFEDVKAIFNKAVAAGAKVLDGVSKCQVDIYMEDIWMARVKDPYGYTWTIRSRLKKKGYLANLWAALLYKY